MKFPVTGKQAVSFSFFIGDTSSTSRLDVPSFPHHSLPETPSYPLPRKASFPRVSRRIPQHYRVHTVDIEARRLNDSSVDDCSVVDEDVQHTVDIEARRLNDSSVDDCSIVDEDVQHTVDIEARRLNDSSVDDCSVVDEDVQHTPNSVTSNSLLPPTSPGFATYQAVRVPFPSGEKELVFRFRTDDYGSGEGFWIEVTPVPGSCGGYDTSEDTDGRTVGCSRISADIEGTLEATSADNDSTRPCFLSVKRRDVGSSGPTSTECDASFFDVSFVLTSPGFPRPISEKAHCRYVIHRASPEVCQLELTFRHFDLPMSRGCVKDFLEVRRQRLCGPQQAFTILDFRDEDKLVLEFVSDGYGDPSRFKISVRQIPCQTITMPDLTSTPSYSSSGRYPGSHIEDETQCSKQIKEPTFEITSPNYPRPYPPNLNCEYSVVAMSAWGICYLDIEFLADLDFGTSNNCEQDFLAINGEKFCDHQPSGATRRFEFREGIKYINFVSDYTGAGSGFYIRGKQVPCGATCDEVIKQNQFSIVSPSYPRPYKNEMECTYFIKRMPGMCGIKLRFHAFDIERSEGCRGDYLKVGLERFCGQMSGLERELSFDGQDMVPIRFHSDGYGTASGFQIDGTQQQCADLSYPPLTSTTTHRSTSPVWPTFPETVPTQWRPPLRPSTAGPPDPTKPPVRCNTVHTDLRGSIQSVDYPEPYPCGLGCIHIIHRIAGYCSVEFQVTDLDIEESDRCFFDWLMIGKERLCGKQSGKTIVVPFTLQTMELKFKSDFYNSGRGYQLEYIQRPCSDAAGEGERILTTTPYPLLGGGITSLGGLNFLWVTAQRPYFSMYFDWKNLSGASKTFSLSMDKDTVDIPFKTHKWRLEETSLSSLISKEPERVLVQGIKCTSVKGLVDSTLM
ncbi:unnamed protein product [Cyprideis torosa]|uniref:Uncharacterized protein n=1 Tax=Cyprideis torosa TaxID=163714 RepID=A0A7R8W3B3_9CRUS|nr:unnamed protein product [Cyprideis torosa]CAG0882832.1 unnamed protein product [Cyprideis torosa]